MLEENLWARSNGFTNKVSVPTGWSGVPRKVVRLLKKISSGTVRSICVWTDLTGVFGWTESDPGLNGCLPFSRKNRMVKSCSTWDASKPRMEISMGFACSISTDISTVTNTSRKAWNKVQRVKSKCNANFPFGNFELFCRNPIFSGNFPFLKTKLAFPLSTSTEISRFFGWMVNNQPFHLEVSSSRHAFLSPGLALHHLKLIFGSFQKKTEHK